SRGEGFGEEVKRRILLGTFALNAGNYNDYFEQAQKVRTLIKQDFEKVFEEYDVIIGPTTPTTAFKFDVKADDPFAMYANDILMIPAHLAGVPSISLPCGFLKKDFHLDCKSLESTLMKKRFIGLHMLMN